jgi:hypothetical protein
MLPTNKSFDRHGRLPAGRSLSWLIIVLVDHLSHCDVDQIAEAEG